MARHSANVSLPDDIFNAYDAQAKHRNVAVARVMSAVLAVVARDDLFKAVLEDCPDLLHPHPRRYRQRVKKIRLTPRGSDHERTEG